MSTTNQHRVRIECPEGMAVLTRVFVDDVELRGVTFVKFEAGIPEKYDAQVTLRLYADVEIIGEPEIVKEWRRAGPALDLAGAWQEAEAACAALPDTGSTAVPCWPRLQGPFPMLLGPTYQADVVNTDGHRRSDERLGLGPTPADALRALAERVAATAVKP